MSAPAPAPRVITVNDIANVQTLAPTTPVELWYWVRNILGVEIPFTRVCPHHVAPFEAFSAAYFAEESMVVWLASRGFGGKSHLLALLALTEAITLGASVNILGGSFEQSKRVHGYITGSDPAASGKFWQAQHAPRWLLKSDPTQAALELINGGRLIALLASQRSVRGPHPARLRADEVDEINIRLLDSAMGQTMEQGGVLPQTVLSSTHQYADGTMTEVLRRAKERGWPVFQWCFKESMEPFGWLKAREVERKRREIPLAMWLNEYEMQDPSPEGRAIDPDAIAELFDARLGEFEGAADRQIAIVKPMSGQHFYHGTDWAKTLDWTVLHTMWDNPKGPDVLAAWARTGRRPWPVMIGMHNARVSAYGGPSMHDVTGIGGVCDDYLTVESEGFNFSNTKERSDMLATYIAAIENREMRFPKIAYIEGEHKFATWDDVFGRGHLPDTIAAGALARRAKEEAGRGLLLGRLS